ncbi:MAG: sulfide-dependent adenosine diphosphate thiazole synthase [Candidatus Omnitrophica bacterium]|nr:sulfide-dependent adenosine diphosphate thiazole synthase [Candidatus Omnitrophota bacterium]
MGVFKATNEAQVTRAITEEFLNEFKEYVTCDAIVVGGGPSGLMASRELARNKVKVLIVEANNYLGGGFWIGGYLMNKLTIRKPAEKILDELHIPYKEYEEGLFVSDGPHACSRLIAAACDAGVKILNMTKVDDVVLKNNRVSGVVINWTPVSTLPKNITCVDPVALEAKVVIDTTGHDACVARALEKRGIIKLEGCGPMDVTSSEEGVVLKTGEVYPGLVVAGMAVSTVYGIPRMGPTFGAMLLSGQKAAEVTLHILIGETIKV